MSMNDSAIQRIEQLAVSAHTGTDLLNVDRHAVALPNGVSLHSLERFMDRPYEMTGTFKTARIEDFCEYISKHITKGETAVFVDPDGGSAVGVLDFGNNDNPGWRRHRANLDLLRSPEYLAAESLCARELSQRALIDWLEDWSRTAVPFTGDAKSTIEKAVTAIRKVSIKTTGESTSEERNFGATKGTLATIDAVSGNGEIPTHIVMPCEVYIDTKERDVKLALSLLTGGSEPRFKARIIGKEALMKDVSDEVETTIKAELRHVDESLPVHIGIFTGGNKD